MKLLAKNLSLDDADFVLGDTQQQNEGIDESFLRLLFPEEKNEL